MIGEKKMSLVDGIITEWGYDDGGFEDAKKEIFEIINKYQMSLSNVRGLLSRVLFDIETKNVVSM